MDFDLSKICDMLGERIEEYKSVSKKRRIIKQSAARTAKKIPKLSIQGQSDIKINGKRVYASTPVDTPKCEQKQFSALFSSITKSSPCATPKRRHTRKLDMKARKLSFDDAQDHNEENDSITKFSTPASFSSATKLSPVDTTKIKRLRRATLNVRRLTFGAAGDNDEVDSLVKNCADDVGLEQVMLSPLKSNLQGLQSTSVYAKRLNCNTTLVEDLSNDCADEKSLTEFELSQLDKSKRCLVQKSNLGRLTLNGEDGQVAVESLFNESTTMVLNVGIFIRPLRQVCEDES